MHLNSQASSVQFAVEMEAAQRLPFLGVLVKKDNGALALNIYTKGTHTDGYLNYKPVHLNVNKRSLVASLLGCAHKTLSNPET